MAVLGASYCLNCGVATQLQLGKELLALAADIAQQAGALLMQRPKHFDLSIKTSVTDFATQMDHKSEALIVSEILKNRPGDGIIGEEGATRKSESGITWVIDPLDGTVNYFYGLPGWNVSIAAKDESGVLVGMVYCPTTQSEWSAIRGNGALYNGQEIQCNDPVALDAALLGTGFAYDRKLRDGQMLELNPFLRAARDVRRMGAAAVDLCFVAMGALDGYYESGLHEWDLAAGGLIATEAGAVLTGRNGAPAGGDMVIAAGPTLHAQMAATLAI